MARRIFGSLAIAALLLSNAALSGVAQDEKPPIRVGILHSLTGTMAISETALKDIELLAIAEINKAGGVLGRQIDPIVEDARSEFTTTFPEKAKKLVVRDKVAAVFGCWTSVSRKNCLPIFEEYDNLLFYPVAFEGIECSKNVVYVAPTPNQQALAAVDWLLSKAGGSKKRFFLVGTDFIYPRTVNFLVNKHLKDKDAVVGIRYTPFGHRDYQSIVDDIKASKADVVLSSINGDSNIYFFDELAAQGIDAKTTPVLSFMVAEDELRGLEPKKMKGHLAATCYFESLPTAANRAFVKNVHAALGDDRALFDAAASAYASVHLWKAAVEKAKSTEVAAVRKALADLEIESPLGKLKVDGKTLYCRMPLRIGRIRDDRQFDILHETAPIVADPYPQIGFPGYGCDWTKRGPSRPAGAPLWVGPPRN